MKSTIQQDWLGLNSSPVFTYEDSPEEYNAFLAGKNQGIVNGIIMGVVVGAVLASLVCFASQKSKKEKQA